MVGMFLVTKKLFTLVKCLWYVLYFSDIIIIILFLIYVYMEYFLIKNSYECLVTVLLDKESEYVLLFDNEKQTLLNQQSKLHFMI